MNAMKDDVRTSDIGLSLQAFWLEWWMMPITLTARMIGMACSNAGDDPEIDRERRDCQLPVPNSHQKAMDHDLFA